MIRSLPIVLLLLCGCGVQVQESERDVSVEDSDDKIVTAQSAPKNTEPYALKEFRLGMKFSEVERLAKKVIREDIGKKRNEIYFVKRNVSYQYDKISIRGDILPTK